MVRIILGLLIELLFFLIKMLCALYEPCQPQHLGFRRKVHLSEHLYTTVSVRKPSADTGNQ